MTKKKELFSNPAFKAESKPTKFNLLPELPSAQSTYKIQDLDETEKNRIEQILKDHLAEDSQDSASVSADCKELVLMTAEIKSIGKQSLLLIGQKIAKARDLLKSYRNGAFTKWLEATFGSIRSGYNFLGYHDLYHSLPDETSRKSLQKMPQKAVYALASREGDIASKQRLIEEHFHTPADKVLLLIREKFPTAVLSKNEKSANKKLIKEAAFLLQRIQKRKHRLSQDEREVLRSSLRSMIDEIIDQPVVTVE